jgi:hypothetical protein
MVTSRRARERRDEVENDAKTCWMRHAPSGSRLTALRVGKGRERATPTS